MTPKEDNEDNKDTMNTISFNNEEELNDDSEKHWCSMSWNVDTKMFEWDDNDCPEVVKRDMPKLDQWKKTHPRDMKRV